MYRAIEFLADESCGKYSPCREGTEVMVEILGRLARDEGVRGDIETLGELSEVMASAALCGLGQGAPVPVTDSLAHFHQDYENRIRQLEYIRSLKGV